MALTPGNWKTIKAGEVISDQAPAGYNKESGHADVTYYGGYLLAESVGNPTDAKLFAQSKNILIAAAELIRDVNREDLPSVRNLKKIITEFI